MRKQRNAVREFFIGETLEFAICERKEDAGSRTYVRVFLIVAGFGVTAGRVCSKSTDTEKKWRKKVRYQPLL
jgi:hypothetical protein